MDAEIKGQICIASVIRRQSMELNTHDHCRFPVRCAAPAEFNVQFELRKAARAGDMVRVRGLPDKLREHTEELAQVRRFLEGSKLNQLRESLRDREQKTSQLKERWERHKHAIDSGLEDKKHQAEQLKQKAEADAAQEAAAAAQPKLAGRKRRAADDESAASSNASSSLAAALASSPSPEKRRKLKLKSELPSLPTSTPARRSAGSKRAAPAVVAASRSSSGVEVAVKIKQQAALSKRLSSTIAAAARYQPLPLSQVSQQMSDDDEPEEIADPDAEDDDGLPSPPAHSPAPSAKKLAPAKSAKRHGRNTPIPASPSRFQLPLRNGSSGQRPPSSARQSSLDLEVEVEEEEATVGASPSSGMSPAQQEKAITRFHVEVRRKK